MPNPKELLIHGGEVVTASRGRQRVDVRIVGEKIVDVGPGLSRNPNAIEMDATGLLVLPGGIDPHVHLTELPEESWKRADDFASGSEAALSGGITTLGNMTSTASGERLRDALQRDEELVRAQSIVDVILHAVIPQPSEGVLAEVGRLVAEGRSSIKIFMPIPGFDANALGYLMALLAAGKAGAITMIHCEDYSILSASAAALLSQGRGSLFNFPESRPVISEVVATQRAIAMCEATGSPIYLVHLSCERALRECEDARDRGLPVYVETRPLYLHLTEERYRGPDGPLYVAQPPLRRPSDVEALWVGLANNGIDVLASDHAPWTREEKFRPELNVANHFAGVANLEVMLPMLFSEGVRKGRISLERFVALTSSNAARLFGLYPRKGEIAPQSDADIALWDPNEHQTVRGSELASRAGYSVYEGMEVVGWPKVVLRRGEVVFRGGKTIGRPGSGQLLRCGPTQPLR